MNSRDTLNILCKWRTILTGWHLGTRLADDGTAPGVAAMRDLQDFRLCIRAEVSAVTALMIEKGIFTAAEFDAALANEATLLERQMQQSFPGFRATEIGMAIDAAAAAETTKRKNFPP